jgi:hypothetical protein
MKKLLFILILIAWTAQVSRAQALFVDLLKDDSASANTRCGTQPENFDCEGGQLSYTTRDFDSVAFRIVECDGKERLSVKTSDQTWKSIVWPKEIFEKNGLEYKVKITSINALPAEYPHNFFYEVKFRVSYQSTDIEKSYITMSRLIRIVFDKEYKIASVADLEK